MARLLRLAYQVIAAACACECMTCALGQHCGSCRTGSHHEDH